MPGCFRRRCTRRESNNRKWQSRTTVDDRELRTNSGKIRVLGLEAVPAARASGEVSFEPSARGLILGEARVEARAL